MISLEVKVAFKDMKYNFVDMKCAILTQYNIYVTSMTTRNKPRLFKVICCTTSSQLCRAFFTEGKDSTPGCNL